ncbi:glucosamine-6-phosphate deaminase [Geosporobacter subterraneus DSM 17957]|uniref:Glucosamine-6-phosphate deaminase n=1 Tax=Geosporobacter subterraneus DSM 17957 TaxID=1121919 RepID=A0A1M6F2J9_9FIRM|nr:glucosamine-6-phosphate deaminase [Geosporobacter subterraneus]SHI91876.1 glucosamine-6-phosphate deaminase [Geosporobacter subterraneus DSM 17957]
MKIYVEENYQKLSKKAAYILASQVRLKPDSVLGLATGDTPLGMYRELAAMHQEEDLDFKEVKTFNLDEYYGLEKENPQSYHYYMMENFFKYVNIQEKNIHIPDGQAPDIEEACRRYEQLIRLMGGIDLQVLGIGRNGHIGFNEPDVKFEATTHLVQLDEDTIQANARFFDSIHKVPTQAISMGIKTIMQAKKIVLLASGREKREVIQRALEGKISPELPASVLQLHNDVVVILDREAAGGLKEI